MSEDGHVYVDASGLVAGRLASKIASLILDEVRVTVVNSEKAVIKGKKERVIGDYLDFKQVKSRVNPRRHGPFKPKTPEGIVRKMVRGMVPHRKKKGKRALERLEIYSGLPNDFSDVAFESIEEAERPPSAYPHITVEELARHVGWKPVTERMVESG